MKKIKNFFALITHYYIPEWTSRVREGIQFALVLIKLAVYLSIVAFGFWWVFCQDAPVHLVTEIYVEKNKKTIYIDSDKEIVIDLSAETSDDSLFILLKEDGTSYRYPVKRSYWLEYVNAQVGDTMYEGSSIHKGRLYSLYYLEKHEGMCKNKVSCIKKLREKNTDVTVVFFEDGRYITVSPSDNMLWSELEEGDTVVERRIGQSVIYSPQP